MFAVCSRYHALRGTASFDALRRTPRWTQSVRLCVPTRSVGTRLTNYLRENVALAQDLDFVAADFNVGAAVFAVDHLVADLDRQLAALAAVEQLAGADRQDLAALRLLFGRVGQDDAAGSSLFGFNGFDDHTIIERTNSNFGHG